MTSLRMYSLALRGLLLLGAVAPAQAANNASFYAQTVPTALVTGETRSVSITMQNNGTTPWTEAAHYRLGTQNPQDNTLWTGATRVLLGGGESIGAGGFKTFTFNITAPATPGTYNFQWRMVQEGNPWDASLPTTLGGDVHGNSVASARQGINVDSAGTAASPLLLYGNTVSNPAPSPGSFQSCSHATSTLNINTGDSVVNRNGETGGTTNTWHNCL